MTRQVEPLMPTVITPEKAAEALGLSVSELAENLQHGVGERLYKLVNDINSISVRPSFSLEHFDEEVASARRLFSCFLECRKAASRPVDVSIKS